MLEAYAHRDMPLDRVIEELAPDRTLSASPFLQAGLNFLEGPDRAGAAGRPGGGAVRLRSGISPFELNLIVLGTAASFQVRLQYRTDLFAPGTITVCSASSS